MLGCSRQRECPWRPEAPDEPGVGVTGSGEQDNAGVGNGS